MLSHSSPTSTSPADSPHSSGKGRASDLGPLTSAMPPTPCPTTIQKPIPQVLSLPEGRSHLWAVGLWSQWTHWGWAEVRARWGWGCSAGRRQRGWPASSREHQDGMG